jgi:hypothetical protein
MHAAIPAAIIAGAFAFALPGQSLAQCNPSNGDCETGELQIETAKTCIERMAEVKSGSAGGRDHKQADGYAKTAEDYDRQADKWDELAENALTPHLEHAYRNQARGLRALADAERERSMVHVVAADALSADCGQRVATLNQVEEAGPEQSSGPAQAIQTEQPAQAETAAKRKPVKAAKRTTKKLAGRKGARGKRVRVVRRSRPRVVIGIGIGFGGIGIGF